MEIQAALMLVIVFGLLLVFSVPVSYSIVITGAITITTFLTPGFGVFISAQKIVGGIDSFTLLAVPFFILAGLLMSSGGIARRLINLAMLVLKYIPGALSLANIAGNTLFGAISGSGIAAATAVGGVMLPLAKEDGYDEGFSAAVNIASAPVGQLIPPTTAFIVYSAASGGTSVAALFMAGIIPGLIWALCCGAVALIIAKKRGYVSKSAKAYNTGSVLGTIWAATPSMFLLVIILGGILSGAFTATEASAIAVAYAFILAVCVYRSIKLDQIPNILKDAAIMTTIVMLIIGASAVLSFVMSFTGLPKALSSLLLGISDNPYVILFIITLCLLGIGTFMDMAPALLIFTPIFLPVVRDIGMSPIHFGVMIVTNLAIGTITPPVGNVLFVGCSIAKLQIENVIKPLIPLFVSLVVALLLITYVPAFSEWLPKLLGLMK
ncbi:MAG: TRAP transporter large permease [Deferribacteraceae bacterium]|jgi:tripartite ATP-independent transporter DctM subunit|nr:TRAP transporter large permease [Deferribacteraceae bacterium]